MCCPAQRKECRAAEQRCVAAADVSPPRRRMCSAGQRPINRPAQGNALGHGNQNGFKPQRGETNRHAANAGRRMMLADVRVRCAALSGLAWFVGRKPRAWPWAGLWPHRWCVENSGGLQPRRSSSLQISRTFSRSRCEWGTHIHAPSSSSMPAQRRVRRAPVHRPHHAQRRRRAGELAEQLEAAVA